MWAPARTSPVTLISGFSCGWLRSRPTNLVGPAVSARIRNVSVPAAAAAAARSAPSDVSSAAGGVTAASLRPSAARKLSSCALSARTWAARESIWRWVGCCAEPALGSATSPASAAITAYRCRLIAERLLFQRSTAGDPPRRDGSAGSAVPAGGAGGRRACYSRGRGGGRGGGGRRGERGRRGACAASSVRSRPAYGCGHPDVIARSARVGAQPSQHPPVVADRVVALRRFDNLNHSREARLAHDAPERLGADRPFADPLVAVEM